MPLLSRRIDCVVWVMISQPCWALQPPTIIYSSYCEIKRFLLRMMQCRPSERIIRATSIQKHPGFGHSQSLVSRELDFLNCGSWRCFTSRPSIFEKQQRIKFELMMNCQFIWISQCNWTLFLGSWRHFTFFPQRSESRQLDFFFLVHEYITPSIHLVNLKNC